ncbi:MAG: carboxylating nicotinate-nucleotide diphosphorylase [Elusimicrobiota bacterium]|nr:carboxylating nicotinate-nucleotide diphosphorylase [Elusimicrobiota bacterium]
MLNKKEQQEFSFLLKRAFSEDRVRDDITSKFLPRARKVKARIVARGDCRLAGMALLPAVFTARSKNIKVRALKKDASPVTGGEIVCAIEGDAGMIFSAERAALNFLSFLSGIATKTASFRKIIDDNWITAGKPALLDTRKTLPGFRYLSKYAVRCGGGVNHRFDLAEVAMVKDNHIAYAGLDSLIEAFRSKKVIFEADDLKSAERILSIKPYVLLCDNFTPREASRAVELRDSMSPRTLIEISGGIDEKTVLKYKHIPVDRISSGALTHSVRAADFSLEV